MAQRKGILLLAGVAVVGAVGIATITDSGGPSIRKVDAGGGATAPASAPPAPYSISTLAPVGTAAQDPGGGGGGTGEPGSVGPPTIQGARGSGNAQGAQGGGDTFYLSGLNFLEASRAATTSGDNSFGSGPTSAAGGTGAGSGSTGCATPPDVDYYSVPFGAPAGFDGAPQVHLRISGTGPVTVRVFQEETDNSCTLVSTGSGTISAGTVDITLAARRFTFRRGSVPTLVVSSPGSHTISTSSGNPSYLRLPGLYGI